MQNKFSADAAAEAEKFLRDEHYSYQKRPDGMLVVPGNIDIGRRGLDRLPDLSCVIVEGSFYCHDNNLTSLKGAPAEVRRGFWCNGNQLETLEYLPRGISGQFICQNNRLTSLKGAPPEVTGDVNCTGNPLLSLEGAPQKFNKLFTSWGTFDIWDEVPAQLKTSPETKAGMAQDAVVLGRKLGISKPIVLRKSSPNP